MNIIKEEMPPFEEEEWCPSDVIVTYGKTYMLMQKVSVDGKVICNGMLDMETGKYGIEVQGDMAAFKSRFQQHYTDYEFVKSSRLTLQIHLKT